jgi:hypothetical protein
MVWLLLYAHRQRSILGAAGHIILTPSNQLMEEYNSEPPEQSCLLRWTEKTSLTSLLPEWGSNPISSDPQSASNRLRHRLGTVMEASIAIGERHSRRPNAPCLCVWVDGIQITRPLRKGWRQTRGGRKSLCRMLMLVGCVWTGRGGSVGRQTVGVGALSSQRGRTTQTSPRVTPMQT